MRGRLHALGGKVELGTALGTFQQGPFGVDATLSTRETIRVDFLVGCDSGRSLVRKILGVKLEGEVLEEKPMFVADVEIDGLSRLD